LQVKLPDTLAIYRFGTCGTVDERADSDLDLAVLLQQTIAFVRYQEVA